MQVQSESKIEILGQNGEDQWFLTQKKKWCRNHLHRRILKILLSNGKVQIEIDKLTEYFSLKNHSQEHVRIVVKQSSYDWCTLEQARQSCQIILFSSKTAFESLKSNKTNSFFFINESVLFHFGIVMFFSHSFGFYLIITE